MLTEFLFGKMFFSKTLMLLSSPLIANPIMYGEPFGDKLLLITTPDEIGEKIDWLKRMIESTNMRVERFSQTRQLVEDAEEADELGKHENIIRDALRMKISPI